MRLLRCGLACTSSVLLADARACTHLHPPTRAPSAAACCAGNEGYDIDSRAATGQSLPYPAVLSTELPTVLSVAATTVNDTLIPPPPEGGCRRAGPWGARSCSRQRQHACTLRVCTPGGSDARLLLRFSLAHTQAWWAPPAPTLGAPPSRSRRRGTTSWAPTPPTTAHTPCARPLLPPPPPLPALLEQSAAHAVCMCARFPSAPLAPHTHALVARPLVACLPACSFKGSSFATPLVASAAALLRAANSTLSACQVGVQCTCAQVCIARGDGARACRAAALL